MGKYDSLSMIEVGKMRDNYETKIAELITANQRLGDRYDEADEKIAELEAETERLRGVITNIFALCVASEEQDDEKI